MTLRTDRKCPLMDPAKVLQIAQSLEMMTSFWQGPQLNKLSTNYGPILTEHLIDVFDDYNKNNMNTRRKH